MIQLKFACMYTSELKSPWATVFFFFFWLSFRVHKEYVYIVHTFLDTVLTLLGREDRHKSEPPGFQVYNPKTRIQLCPEQSIDFRRYLTAQLPRLFCSGEYLRSGAPCISPARQGSPDPRQSNYIFKVQRHIIRQCHLYSTYLPESSPPMIYWYVL